MKKNLEREGPAHSLLAVVVLAVAASTGGAQGEHPYHTPFDFKDGFYRQNGLEPRFFATRVVPEDVHATSGVSGDSTRNHTRILEVNGGFDAAGALLYYPAPPAFFPLEAFRDGPVGDHAYEVANKFRAFIFPRRDGDPLSPAPPNRRQDNVFDTSSGYLGRNPLGLWRITFPRYTEAAFATAGGRAALEVVRARNGTDLDGTPIIKRLSEIKELEALGFLELRQRPEDGSAGAPWVV